MSPEELVLRSLFAFLLTVMTGINIWQYAMATEYDSVGAHKPLMKRLFLVEAGVTAATGLYLFVSTVL